MKTSRDPDIPAEGRKRMHSNENKQQNIDDETYCSISSECLDSWATLGESLASSPPSSQNVESQPAENTTLLTSRSVETGFVTGSNRKVLVDEEKLKKVRMQILESSQESEQMGDKIDDKLVVPVLQSMSEIQNMSEVQNMPEIQNKLVVPALYKVEESNAQQQIKEEIEIRKDIEECFSEVRSLFKREEVCWLAVQFKWAWMDCWMNEVRNYKERIIEQIGVRIKYEYSILRRISEFDDTPCRHMVLGVLELNKNSVKLFDGFYEAYALISDQLFRQLQIQGCTTGTKLHVFGSERLISSEREILSLDEPLLRLFINSVRLASSSLPLGISSSFSFRIMIRDILPDGGVISAVIVRIKRIIERKVRVSLGSYHKDVEDVEKEIENIGKILKQSGVDGTISSQLRTTAFTIVEVGDETGICKLIWWNPPDIRVGTVYKLVYLKPVSKSRLFLSFDYHGYSEMIANT